MAPLKGFGELCRAGLELMLTRTRWLFPWIGGILVVGVLIPIGLLFGIGSRLPDFWKLPCMLWENSAQRQNGLGGINCRRTGVAHIHSRRMLRGRFWQSCDQDEHCFGHMLNLLAKFVPEASSANVHVALFAILHDTVSLPGQPCK